MKHLISLAILLSAASVGNAATTQSGICNNGLTFSVTQTQVDVSGVMRPYFIYEGPQGQGEIQSSVDLAAAVEHVCRSPAERRWLDDEQRDD